VFKPTGYVPHVEENELGAKYRFGWSEDYFMKQPISRLYSVESWLTDEFERNSKEVVLIEE
jgi:hypothetical protein